MKVDDSYTDYAYNMMMNTIISFLTSSYLTYSVFLHESHTFLLLFQLNIRHVADRS